MKQSKKHIPDFFIPTNTLVVPVILVLLLFLIISCNSKSRRNRVDVSGTDIGQVSIKRYGKAIFSLDTSRLQEELKRIKPEFPLFLNGDLDDQETIEKMAGFVTDEQLIASNRDCQDAFRDLSWLQEGLTDLFRHLKHYYPEQNPPEVYTYVSGFDFEFRTQYYNENLIIALDMYMGPDYPPYQKLGVPQYVLHKFQPAYISRDCAMEIAKSKINFKKPGNDLLDFMINEGKLLWFVKAMVPSIDDGILFDYTPEQLEWAGQYEGLVWAFMIENEALYSAEPDFRQKFILEGPFTSYFGQDSPPRLGAYIGYRIVDHYMQRHGEVSLADLMQEYNAPMILKGSKYKPEL
jgi:hypothetical protein